MKKFKKSSLFRFLIYGLLVCTIAWQGYGLFQDVNVEKLINSSPSIVVNVKGNIKTPGYYQVPLGTSHFEILQVAGVTNTSDLTPFNLANQVESDKDISVGTLQSPVGIKSNARLEFFFGDLTVISLAGLDRLPQEGMNIDEGDRILVEENSQAEFSLNTFSRIDMDSYSEITFDKFDINSDGKSVTELFHKSGICWYQIAYSDKEEQYAVATDLARITVAGKGADYTVDVKYNETVINVIDGLLLVERPDGSDAINLIAGQTVTISNDNRPFQVSKLTPGASLTNRFTKLSKTKADLIVKYMPFNLLFFSSPNVFFFISVQFSKSTVSVVHLPAQTSVTYFVQGFTTLQEASLYGGIVFTSTLVERILNTRINKYIVFDKNDIIRTASSIGGISIAVDNKASAYLNIKKGTHLFKGQGLIEFLRPSLSGSKDSEQRQISAIKSIFEQIRSKNIIVTSLLADQILTNLETNVSASETMTHYNNFLSRKNWKFEQYSLPINIKKEGNKIIYEPILEKTQKLLTNE